LFHPPLSLQIWQQLIFVFYEKGCLYETPVCTPTKRKKGRKKERKKDKTFLILNHYHKPADPQAIYTCVSRG
jgi:hypothetical protein